MNQRRKAGFSAHTSNRDKIDEIFADQLASGIDLFFGSNIEYYAPLKEEISKKYAFTDDMSSLDLNQPKIFASFEEIPLNNGGSKKPTLAELSLKAIEKLSANPNGFFLMIEESHIDKFSHDNELLSALEHLKAFDNAVKAVVEKAAEIGNTVVIVTADHETGGLEYNGETKEQLSDKMYTRTRHSDANVAYFVFGTVDCEFPKIIDNTQIGNLCKSIISAEAQ